MNFIGVDLAWKIGGETAVVAMSSQGDVTAHGSEEGDEELAAFVERHAGDGCLVGVDAPLVVPNNAGRRRCEDELQSLGIPSYPANRSWLVKAFGAVRGEILVAELERRGIKLLDSLPTSRIRGVMEVYPYATLRAVLREIPGYKKGPRAERRREIMRLAFMLEGLNPPLRLPPELLRGVTLKDLKKASDFLDAGVAAYTVYICFKKPGKCITLGNKKEGFVLLPRKP